MISLDWVKDYIDISDQDLKELAVKITKAGINIEKVITNHIDNLVIGEVVDCVNHPNSDHLHVCQVNVGNELVQIVCGASNVRKGLKVIVALPGAVLPGNFVIQKGKIRDVESNGMLARLHYGERVLTRSEAAQYNSLEDDIKSGKLQDYFDSLEEDAKVSVSSAISTNISAQKSLPDTTSNTNQFVIENITLPNVNEPADFTSELESWASREFGGLAQKAKIKRAK